MANPSGASFSVDAYATGGITIPAPDPDASIGVDMFLVSAPAPQGREALPTPDADASINVDVHLASAPAPQGRVSCGPVSPRASINVDMNHTTTPPPARMKVWDGARWVPLRGYVYDSALQAWVPTA